MNGWPRWNPGIERIALPGVFAAGSHVVYAIAVEGPEAAEIGGAISADFPEVLARLAEAARKNT